MESLELFEKLKVALGEDVAFELMQLRPIKQDLSNLATKDNIKELKEDIKNYKTDVERSISRATWLIGILITLAVVIIKYAP